MEVQNPKFTSSLFSPPLHLQETLGQVMGHWHVTCGDLSIDITDIAEGNKGDPVKLPRPYS